MYLARVLKAPASRWAALMFVPTDGPSSASACRAPNTLTLGGEGVKPDCSATVLLKVSYHIRSATLF